MKKNRKKKLPKYWLGTRLPASLGYLKAKDAGNVSYTTTPGEDFTQEADAERANILPSAINRLQLSTTPLLNMFLNVTKVTTPVIGSTAGSLAADVAANSGKFAGDLASSFGTGTTKYATSFFGPSESGFVGTNAGVNAGSTATRTALNAAGKAIGAVGAAYGAANMVNDFLHNKDHRTVANMWDTVNTNTYTTDKGNTYNTYSGPNLLAELDYGSAQKTSRNINNIINSAGTGAAIGTLIAPGIGTILGTIGGGFYGGMAALLGFGDTYDYIIENAKKTQDVAALKSLQSEASSKNKDVYQEFYDRSSSDGRYGAAKGKMPMYADGKPVYGRGGKTNAKVSNGELIGNLEEGWVLQVPGEPNNKDTKNANLRSSDYVISNPFVPLAMSTGDIEGTLILLDMYNRNKLNFKQAPMKAKCGKMPKYSLGTALMTAAPNIAQSLAAWMLYNNDRKSTPYAHTTTADYSPSINQGYAMLSNKIDKRPYMRAIDNDISKHFWNVRRIPGLGLGGRASLIDSAAIQGIRAKADKALEIDEKNIALDNAARTYIGNILAHSTDINNQNFHDWAKRYAVATGARYNNLATDLKNIVQPFGYMAKDLISNYKFDESQRLKNRMIGIYEKGADSKDSAVISDLLRQYSAYGSPWMATGSYIDNLSAALKQALYELLAKEYNASK